MTTEPTRTQIAVWQMKLSAFAQRKPSKADVRRWESAIIAFLAECEELIAEECDPYRSVGIRIEASRCLPYIEYIHHFGGGQKAAKMAAKVLK